jgi:hypothetical protein
MNGVSIKYGDFAPEAKEILHQQLRKKLILLI